MIFLNSLLALAGITFVVPLAIHLLFRHRFNVLDWGAMHLLDAIVRVNKRRMRLRNLLLLLLRCAIPILLAICMARPVLTGWQTPAGDDPLSMVMVVDTSYSLAQRFDTSTRRIDLIRDSARRVIEALPRGSDVVVLSSDGSSHRGDHQTAGTFVDRLGIGGGPLDAEELLSRALRESSMSATQRRQVLLLSDHRAADWSQRTIDSLSVLRRRVDAMSPRPLIAWVDPFVSRSRQPPATATGVVNRRISRLQPRESTASIGQTVRWLVEARVEGNDSTSVTIELRVNGMAHEEKSVPLRSGVATTHFDLVLQADGRHVIEARVSSGLRNAAAMVDAFAPDDSMLVDFLVTPPIDVWLISGSPRDGPLGNDTDYLAIALSPHAMAGEIAHDRFHTRTVRAGNLLRESEKGHPDVIVLADVGRIDSRDADYLIDHVETRGGTLVVFAGPSTEGDRYDDRLRGSDDSPLLPLRFDQVIDLGDDWQTIDSEGLTYPPLAVFSESERGSLDAVEVAKYRKMQFRQSEDSSRVVLRLANGEPLIAIGRGKTEGAGAVMQVAITCDDDWSSMPRRPAFVPLMQRLFAHLATGQRLAAPTHSGRPLVLPPGIAEGASVDSNAVTVWTPGGELARTAVDPSTGTIRVDDTRQAGVYRIKSGDQTIGFAAIAVPTVDLSLVAAEVSQVDSIAEKIGAVRFAAIDDYLREDSDRRYGRGIWTYFLVALLAVMILEPVVQQRGARAT